VFLAALRPPDSDFALCLEGVPLLFGCCSGLSLALEFTLLSILLSFPGLDQSFGVFDRHPQLFGQGLLACPAISSQAIFDYCIDVCLSELLTLLLVSSVLSRCILLPSVGIIVSSSHKEKLPPFQVWCRL